MQEVHILLGGNLGDRLFYLQKAHMEIEAQIGKIIRQSRYYETAPWGFEHENKFINQVICLKTGLPMSDLLHYTQKIEKKLGRQSKKSGTYEGRTIDIDILFYDDAVYNSPELQIPHLRLHERRFTLVPLAEVSPNLVHPVFKKTANELLLICDDRGDVEPLSLAQVV